MLLSLLVVAAAVSGAWVAVAVAAVTMLLCSVCVCGRGVEVVRACGEAVCAWVVRGCGSGGWWATRKSMYTAQLVGSTTLRTY